MSMWLEYAKVSPETLEALKKNSALMDAIFFDNGTRPADFDYGADVIGLDYRMLLAVTEGMEEAGMDVSWNRKATGEDEFGEALEFEFNYGPAFAFSVEEVKTLAQGLCAEMWNPDEEFEENIGAFFTKAAAEGKAIIGGIN